MRSDRLRRPRPTAGHRPGHGRLRAAYVLRSEEHPVNRCIATPWTVFDHPSQQCVLEYGHEGRHRVLIGKSTYEWTTRSKTPQKKVKRFGKTVCGRRSRYDQEPCFRYEGHAGDHRYRKNGQVHTWSSLPQKPKKRPRCPVKNLTGTFQCRGLEGHTNRHWVITQGKVFRWGPDGVLRMPGRHTA